MASVSHFLKDAFNIYDEIVRRNRDAEKNSIKEFEAARHIQRHFRGYITRLHVQLLHHSATVIQKNWRAFTDRNLYRVVLKAAYDEMCWSRYHFQATNIERCWRGYYVRTRIFSYYELKAWLAFVREKNRLLMCDMKNYRDTVLWEEIALREKEAMQWTEYILYKLHHLIRTRQIRGIYSLPCSANLSDIEKLLQSLLYYDFMKFYHSYVRDIEAKIAREPSIYMLQRCPALARCEKHFKEQRKPHKDSCFARGSYEDMKMVGDMGMRPFRQIYEVNQLVDFKNSEMSHHSMLAVQGKECCCVVCKNVC